MAQDKLETRLVELESQVAQNQETLDELNEVVRKQWQDIDLLKAEMQVLGREVLRLTEGEAEARLRKTSP